MAAETPLTPDDLRKVAEQYGPNGVIPLHRDTVMQIIESWSQSLASLAAVERPNLSWRLFAERIYDYVTSNLTTTRPVVVEGVAREIEQRAGEWREKWIIDKGNRDERIAELEAQLAAVEQEKAASGTHTVLTHLHDPWASGRFEMTDESDVPEALRKELIQVSQQKAISVYYLNAIYRQGRVDAPMLSLAQWCAEERADGAGPCGACSWCCKQQSDRAADLEAQLSSLEKERDAMQRRAEAAEQDWQSLEATRLTERRRDFEASLRMYLLECRHEPPNEIWFEAAFRRHLTSDPS